MCSFFLIFLSMVVEAKGTFGIASHFQYHCCNWWDTEIIVKENLGLRKKKRERFQNSPSRRQGRQNNTYVNKLKSRSSLMTTRSSKKEETRSRVRRKKREKERKRKRERERERENKKWASMWTAKDESQSFQMTADRNRLAGAFLNQ